ncbi:MAG: hypothetical protein A2X93_03400 [Deltaproteobacteria bacterium GWC2_56_8]|nr:MAG: hypothetical protein A2X99_02960 [Deltaproteobacteria bacterium GWB2_55_19]OGP37657.1 MAG: hypothetical protein A2X93_03400 [Deltaproteobacteria bacterium GWC2_56_8]HAO93967.1 hypothetical protein [Deltaproteobacteria bacterium]
MSRSASVRGSKKARQRPKGRAVLAGLAKFVSKAIRTLTSIASEELWHRAERGGGGRRARSPMPRKARQGAKGFEQRILTADTSAYWITNKRVQVANLNLQVSGKGLRLLRSFAMTRLVLLRTKVL